MQATADADAPATPVREAGPAPPWFAVSADEAARRLGVDPGHGLDPGEAARRLERDGPNALAEAKGRGPLRLFAAQFADFMVLILIAAAVVAGLLGEPADIVAILVIVVLNAVLGFVQEFRAERALAALRALASPSARVRRGGTTLTLPASGLVVGDVVLLEAGNVVPADLRLLDAAQLRVEEAALTGESQPAEKSAGVLPPGTAAVGDRRNQAYKGTTVTYGRGTGLVVATGMATELGRIAALLRDEPEVRTPLQRRLARFGQRLAVAVVALCAVIFLVGLLRGEPPVLMFMTALSLSVAAIPEALPAVVTVSLALGARRLVRQNALIRRLPAVETLGSVTYICSDKTGTLTENRMRVEAVDAGLARPSGRVHPVLMEALALSNDAEAGPDGGVEGDPTEVALYRAAADAGYVRAELEARMPRVGEVPFSSDRARMTTLHRGARGAVAFTKGAPERVLPGCVDRLRPDGSSAPLDAGEVLAAAERMAASGLRVLAFAVRHLPEVPRDPAAAEEGQSFVGLVGLMDPPREGAAEAVALCQSAGIHVVMITGDHPATARAVAARLGIARETGDVATGVELASLAEPALAERVARARVCARVAPEDKIRIVRALQARGEIVAMTGDGVNDAPALRRADIGVAMGRGGTDVAREAAHMVLLDDNFATIVRAVREGRRIYDNVRRFIRYTLTSNAGEIWALFLAPFLGLPIPLLPIHILWVNLVTDGLPGLALAVEPAERDVMRRPPRRPAESVFAHGLWQHAVWVGLLMGGVTLATQAWAYRTGNAHWQSMAFTVLTLSQMGHVLAVRSERDSLFTMGVTSNRPLLGAVVLTFGLQLSTLYVPVLQRVFRTHALTPGELAICLVLSSVVFLGVELEKLLVRKEYIYRD
jgi:Ca2+-transporting ATPase